MIDSGFFLDRTACLHNYIKQRFQSLMLLPESAARQNETEPQ